MSVACDQAAAGSSAEAAYARLEALCCAMRTELGVDLRIHDAAVLPHLCQPAPGHRRRVRPGAALSCLFWHSRLPE